MPENYEILEKSSGLFFTIGTVFSKLQYLPVTAIRISSNITALLMYLVGYFLWIAACQKYPGEKPERHHWYTFAEFKAQFTASAIIGSIAMAYSLLAIINTAALVISAWLMALSNLLWVIGERNKIDNPPRYRQLADLKTQQTYFNYCTIVLAISLITACSVTGVLFFPAIAAYIASAASILTTGLTLWSFEHILENWFPAPSDKAAATAADIPEANPSLIKIHLNAVSKNKHALESNIEPKPENSPGRSSSRHSRVIPDEGGITTLEKATETYRASYEY